MSQSEMLFIDASCPRPYSDLSLKTGGIGGTEATVVRIAENLPSPVTVVQHNRSSVTTSLGNVAYRPLLWGDLKGRWGTVVVLRDPEMAIAMRKRFQHTENFWLWLHDIPNNTLVGNVSQLADMGIGLIFVSQWQKTQALELFRSHNIRKYPKTKILYNPIANDLKPDSTHVDRNKLVFFSSPHKGLSQALTLFQKLREHDPEFRLYVANPGYLANMDVSTAKNVFNLGELSHAEVLQQVREALCVFYPNSIFPETFGLVFAEANAVGTPVLTHDLGAAREVLTSPNTQIVGCNISEVVHKVRSWKDGGRPSVVANTDYRLDNVIRQWRYL